MKTVLFTLLLFVVVTAKENGFYFVQITDTHWGKKGNLERTEKVVKAINELPMDIACVIHTGDIMNWDMRDTTILDSGLTLLQQLKAPIHFLPGNNDIIEGELGDLYYSRFGNEMSATYSGVTFAFINTTPLRTGKPVEGVDPISDLKAVMKIAGRNSVVVAHHAPSVQDLYANTMHEGWPDSSVTLWEKTVNSGNVKAILAGHFHRGEQHWIGDVPLYVSAPVDGSWGRQLTFRLFEYRDGKLGYRTIYVK